MPAPAKPRSKTDVAPVSNAERQRQFRQRRSARLHELEEQLLLRNEPTPDTPSPLRNATAPAITPSLRNAKGVVAITSLRNAVSDQTADDKLTALRRRGDQLIAAYLELLPNLTAAEKKTIHTRYVEWLKLFDARSRERYPNHGRSD